MALSGVDFSGFPRVISSFESAQHVFTERRSIERPVAINDLGGGSGTLASSGISALLLAENPDRTFLYISSSVRNPGSFFIGLGAAALADGSDLEVLPGINYLFAAAVPTCAVYVVCSVPGVKYVVYESPPVAAPPPPAFAESLDFSQAANSQYAFLLFAW
jgi:hypothetical protein